MTTQKHLRWTIVGPDSSYSPLEFHICWKVLSEERIEPPIQTEYFLSGGATTLIFMVEGAKAVSSLVMRSPMPDGWRRKRWSWHDRYVGRKCDQNFQGQMLWRPSDCAHRALSVATDGDAVTDT